MSKTPSASEARAPRQASWPRGLLVSVRNAQEASLAAAAGVAIIDVKEPRQGPLGCATANVTAAIAGVVGHRAALTLACGELAAESPTIAADECPLAAGSHRILSHLADVLRLLPATAAWPRAVKVGPAGLTINAWRDRFTHLLARLPEGIEGVAVAYADWQRAAAPPTEAVLTEAVQLGVGTLLIDTFDKRGAGLFGVVSPETLQGWSALASSAGITLAVAGRLSPDDVAAASRLGADVVGVRTAACDGGRDGQISHQRVRFLATLIASADRPPSTRS